MSKLKKRIAIISIIVFLLAFIRTLHYEVYDMISETLTLILVLSILVILVSLAILLVMKVARKVKGVNS